MSRRGSLCLTALLCFHAAFAALPVRPEAPARTPVRSPAAGEARLRREITAAIERFHAASTAGDLAGIERAISTSPTTYFLGSESREIFVGHDAIVQWWANLFSFFAGLGYPHGGLQVISDGKLLQVRRVGDVVFAAAEAHWRFKEGDVPFHLTLALRKEGGRWKIVQGHFSNPLPTGQLPL